MKKSEIIIIFKKIKILNNKNLKQKNPKKD